MLRYINTGVDLAMEKRIDAMVTGPITKTAMKMAGSAFSGHTELIASRTGAKSHAMMLAGDRLKVILVTIHIPLNSVSRQLNTPRILETIQIAGQALKQRFGIKSPRIAVAGLNPHAGESGLFGSEEEEIIAPAVSRARALDIDATGPLPPDTVFFAAVNEKRFDAVICMYHDQGLIPFKLIHFKDGVNTTLGLPIIRTSVDHGTAYDIAFQGIADHSSLMAAIRMAAFQAACKEIAS
jgi:4-hydroxythreonine-4-phosphate dehydrogenase